MTLWVEALTSQAGYAFFSNENTGQIVDAYPDGPNGATLCEKDAEWIVQDWSLNASQLVPFANFGSVTFTGTTAAGLVGLNSSGAKIYNIRQGNTVMTSTRIQDDSVLVSFL